MTTDALVIAHRGASGYRPEHSRSAYELAIELGADAIEPDLVVSKDGVLVLRHENEISGTTDVAERAEFAGRRTTKTIEGASLTGWFTEDFTWAELSTLRVRERLPALRAASAAFDDTERMLRLDDLLGLLDAAPRSVGLVAEIKHADYFESIGLPLGELTAAALSAAGWAGDPRLTIESFEQAVLHDVAARGVGGRLVYLVEKKGAAADQVARHGRDAVTYAQQVTPEGLAELAASGIAGISLDKAMLIDARGIGHGDVVDAAHAAGLAVFTWTLRAENAFLAAANRGPGGKAARGDWRAEFETILGLGVDGVFADQPELAIEAREARVG